jgi:hypothetical protein
MYALYPKPGLSGLGLRCNAREVTTKDSYCTGHSAQLDWRTKWRGINDKERMLLRHIRM